MGQLYDALGPVLEGPGGVGRQSAGQAKLGLLMTDHRLPVVVADGESFPSSRTGAVTRTPLQTCCPRQTKPPPQGHQGQPQTATDFRRYILSAQDLRVARDSGVWCSGGSEISVGVAVVVEGYGCGEDPVAVVGDSVET